MIIESNYRRSKKCVVDMDDDSSELMCSMYSDDLILEDSSESEEQFDKFVQSVMNGGTNIFDEIKKFRRTS